LPPMAFWAYLLRCSDGSYYAGQTDNLEARIGTHHSGLYGGYTASRRPITLVWCQDFPSRLEALQSERQIKGWSRAKKEALIASDWDRISLLARNRQAARSPSTGSGRTEAERMPPVSGRADPVEAPPRTTSPDATTP
ncbi:GIY-YIG nuclease family protein, partial [Sphingomonas sp. GC_Shp_4]